MIKTTGENIFDKVTKVVSLFSMLVTLLVALIFSNLACNSIPKNFTSGTDTMTHQNSGLILPKSNEQWQQVGEVSENLTPEINATVSYQYLDEKKEFKPFATVYILKNKTTANVKLIENRSVTGLINASFIKSETMKLKNKKKISVNIYDHQSDFKNSYATVALNKEFKVQSWFVQSSRKLQLVIWLTFNRESKDEKAIALEFIEDILSKNGI